MRKENEIRMESNRRLWGEGRAGTLPPPAAPKNVEETLVSRREAGDTCIRKAPRLP